MSTRELVKIMTGVTPPKEWVIKKPGEHAAKNFRLVRPVGINHYHQEIFAAIAEITTSRSSEDNYSDKTERQRAEFLLRAAQNFEPLVLALQAAERVLHSDYEGRGGKDLSCGTWEQVKAAFNNALKP